MVQESEMNVYTTVTNISSATITAIGFGASHTNNFGETLTPYKTDLTAEHTIKPGASRAMEWEILMEEHAGKDKPGTSTLYVDKVAFADGRSLGILDIADGCSFTF
jgi:hypothetical protein